MANTAYIAHASPLGHIVGVGVGVSKRWGCGHCVKTAGGPKLTNNDTRNHEEAFFIYFLQDINTTLPNQEWSIPNWQD